MYSPYSNYKHVRIYGLLPYLYSQAQLRPSLGSCDVKFSQSDSNLSDFEVISVSEVGGSRNRVSTGTEELLKKYRPLGKNCLREGKCFFSYLRAWQNVRGYVFFSYLRARQNVTGYVFISYLRTWQNVRGYVFFSYLRAWQNVRGQVFFSYLRAWQNVRGYVFLSYLRLRVWENVRGYVLFFLPDSMAKCERVCVFFLPESMAKCERVSVSVILPESMTKCNTEIYLRRVL